jgi:hypothetical protein
MLKVMRVISPSKYGFPIRFRLARLLLGSAEPYFHRDELTGLPTRTALEDLTRNENGFAVLFIDLDDFKLVNNQLGYAGGDNVIRQVTSNLAQYVRKNDLAIRWGGDEFVLVLNDTSPRGAARVATRLRCLLVEKGIGLSIGVGASVTAAQHGLKNAKKSGKGCVKAIY